MNLEFDYVPNKNGRIYPEHSFNKAIEKYQEKVDSCQALGELEHPSSFDVSLSNASHMIEEMKLCYKRLPRKKKKLMKKNGKYESWRNMNRHVHLKIKLFETTPAGLMVKDLIDAFGTGSIEMGMRGAGNANSDGTIDNLTIFAWDIISKDAKA